MVCDVKASKRYSCELALKHPWITRDSNDKIPLNFFQEIENFEIGQKLKNVIYSLSIKHCVDPTCSLLHVSCEVWSVSFIPASFTCSAKPWLLIPENYRDSVLRRPKAGKFSERARLLAD